MLLLPTKNELEESLDRDAKDVFTVHAKALCNWPDELSESASCDIILPNKLDRVD